MARKKMVTKGEMDNEIARVAMKLFSDNHTPFDRNYLAGLLTGVLWVRGYDDYSQWREKVGLRLVKRGDISLPTIQDIDTLAILGRGKTGIIANELTEENPFFNEPHFPYHDE